MPRKDGACGVERLAARLDISRRPAASRVCGRGSECSASTVPAQAAAIRHLLVQKMGTQEADNVSSPSFPARKPAARVGSSRLVPRASQLPLLQTRRAQACLLLPIPVVQPSDEPGCQCQGAGVKVGVGRRSTTCAANLTSP